MPRSLLTAACWWTLAILLAATVDAQTDLSPVPPDRQLSSPHDVFNQDADDHQISTADFLVDPAGQDALNEIQQVQSQGLQDMDSTIEVRSITVSDRFFERIGVDYDFTVDAFGIVPVDGPFNAIFDGGYGFKLGGTSWGDPGDTTMFPGGFHQLGLHGGFCFSQFTGDGNVQVNEVGPGGRSLEARNGFGYDFLLGPQFRCVHPGPRDRMALVFNAGILGSIGILDIDYQERAFDATKQQYFVQPGDPDNTSLNLGLVYEASLGLMGGDGWSAEAIYTYHSVWNDGVTGNLDSSGYSTIGGRVALSLDALREQRLMESFERARRSRLSRSLYRPRLFRSMR